MRWVRRTLLGLMALVVVIAGLATWALRSSLPLLDGKRATAAVTAAVTLERDSLGAVTIRARGANDLAYALGFAHGQDRFFQMDSARRLAAGELAELFGARVLPQDMRTRLFRLRARAKTILLGLSPADRAWLESYALGVNAGLEALGSRPFEYWLLRSPPQAWQAEDALLVAYSMAWQLQAAELTSERLRMRLAQQLSSADGGDSSRARVQAITEMLLPHTAEWDAPNFATLADEAAASVAPLAALPTQEQLNLRARRVVRRAASASFLAQEVPEREPMLGSNAWVLAGWRTSSGAALVANDMHLGLGVPPVWYRARLLDGEHDWVGVTLPGTPALIAGSNTHIAWGFTNSYGDWFDLRSADCPKPDTPGVTVVTETLKARGGASQTLEVLESPAGIVYQRRDATDCVLVSWHALAPGTISLNIRELMRARSVADAVALAPRLGIAQQNMMVGDRAGRIAWTIAGSLPTAESGHPSLIDPQEGALWTANARAVAGAAEEAIGGDEWRTGSGYDLGARARQIRDGLRGLSSPATPAAMLALQRDARALYLARWRSLLLGVLDEDALRNHPSRAELRLIVAQWDARASVDSVGYRLVKAFHDRLERAVWQMMLEALAIDASEFAPSRRFAATVWRLVSEQPVHLLAPEYSDWRTFQLQQVDATLAELAASCPRLARCRWGDVNRSSVRHPLSRALPVLGHWLDMPDLALDGDTDMPLVQRPGFGASERFAVSPGHEAEGYLQLPGGQSGHPLSPFYRAGFDDWANGAPTPLLPGATRHRLDFLPLTSTSSTP